MIKINLATPAKASSLAASLLEGRTFVPLLIAAVAICASLFPDFGALLELRPEAALVQPWRLFTGHLAHWSEPHLLWDLLVFLALAPLVPPRRLLILLPAAAVSISAGVLLCHPQLESYRGLSGLDSALFAALALDLARRPRPLDRALGALALALFGGKIVFELASGQALFASGPFVPLPLVHLLGLLAALGAAFFSARRPMRRFQLCHNAPR